MADKTSRLLLVLALVFSMVPAMGSFGSTYAMMLALMIGALITNIICKPVFARTRPYEVIDGLMLLVKKQMDYSFPSGHSCASFAGALAGFKQLPRPYGAGLLVLAGLIAFSRLYVGVHYPSDVLGGILIGLFAGWAACKIVECV